MAVGGRIVVEDAFDDRQEHRAVQVLQTGLQGQCERLGLGRDVPRLFANVVQHETDYGSSGRRKSRSCRHALSRP